MRGDLTLEDLKHYDCIPGDIDVDAAWAVQIGSYGSTILYKNIFGHQLTKQLDNELTNYFKEGVYHD